MTSPMLTRAATRAMSRTWRPGPVEEAKAFLAAQDRNALKLVACEAARSVRPPGGVLWVDDVARAVVDALLDGPSA